ncbi:MAG: hypothetical protein QMB52_11605 [Propionivibrio sp.]
MFTLNRQRDPGIPDGAVDINDHIVQDNMFSTQDVLGEAHHGYISGVDVSDEIILEGEPIAVEPPKKRFRPGQIIILSVTAVVAVGGVATFFKPEAAKPTAVALVQNATPAAPQPAGVTLPAGLSFVDKDAPAAAPAPVQPEASPIAPVAAVTANPAPSPAAVVPPPKVESSAPPATAPGVTSPTTPVAATPAPAPQAEAAKPVPANPVAAQVEEAKHMMATSTTATATPTKKPTPPAKAEPVAVPKVSEKESVAKTESKPRAQQPAPNSEKTTPSASSSKKSTPEDQPKTVAKAATEKPVSSRKAPAVEAKEEKDTGTEMIKALVTTSAEAFGLQSIQEGAITLERNRGASSQRFTVGDRLPSGEQILRIDARSMTLVTDRSVIRFN